MHVFILAWALTLGYLPIDDSYLSSFQGTRQILQNDNAYSVDLSLELRALEHLRIYGDVKTYAEKGTLYSYYPFESEYRIGIELYSRNVRLGIRHECDHPTVSDAFQAPQILAQKTEIYFTLQGKTNL